MWQNEARQLICAGYRVGLRARVLPLWRRLRVPFREQYALDRPIKTRMIAREPEY